jgi:hypothetical protein
MSMRVRPAVQLNPLHGVESGRSRSTCRVSAHSNPLHGVESISAGDVTSLSFLLVNPLHGVERTGYTEWSG